MKINANFLIWIRLEIYHVLISDRISIVFLCTLPLFYIITCLLIWYTNFDCLRYHNCSCEVKPRILGRATWMCSNIYSRCIEWMRSDAELWKEHGERWIGWKKKRKQGERERERESLSRNLVRTRDSRGAASRCYCRRYSIELSMADASSLHIAISWWHQELLISHS